MHVVVQLVEKDKISPRIDYRESYHYIWYFNGE